MTLLLKLANNATSTLAAAITDSQTSIALAPGTGSLFPTITGDEYFPVTVVNASNQVEIMKCVARTGDTLTVSRGQEGTTARAYALGDRIDNRSTAAELLNLGPINKVQFVGTDIQLKRGDRGAVLVVNTANRKITFSDPAILTDNWYADIKAYGHDVDVDPAPYEIDGSTGPFQLYNGQTVRIASDGTHLKSFFYDEDVVRTSPQTFDAAKQRAARTNIGAGPANVASGGRISAHASDPVPTEVATATAISLIPYQGNELSVLEGGVWVPALFATPVVWNTSAGTAGVPNDLWAYRHTDGTVRLEHLAWTNGTLRAVNWEWADGVRVKVGDNTRRLVGTVRLDGSKNAIDNNQYRWVSNVNNRVRRTLQRFDPSGAWVYVALAIRQANGNPANEVNFVNAVNDDIVECDCKCMWASTLVGGFSAMGIGLDATNAFAAGSTIGYGNAAAASIYKQLNASFSDYVGEGEHKLVWNEVGDSDSGQSQFWYGTANGPPIYIRGGMNGSVFA